MNKYYKAGYCDGLLGRISTPPLWQYRFKRTQYCLGYIDGKLSRLRNAITLEVNYNI